MYKIWGSDYSLRNLQHKSAEVGVGAFLTYKVQICRFVHSKYQAVPVFAQVDPEACAVNPIYTRAVQFAYDVGKE